MPRVQPGSCCKDRLWLLGWQGLPLLPSPIPTQCCPKYPAVNGPLSPSVYHAEWACGAQVCICSSACCRGCIRAVMVEEEIIGEGRGVLTCAELFSLCECWLVFVVSLAWKKWRGGWGGSLVVRGTRFPFYNRRATVVVACALLA